MAPPIVENVVKSIKSIFVGDKPPEIKKKKPLGAEGVAKKRPMKPAGEESKKPKKSKALTLVGPERDKEGSVDLNKIFDHANKKKKFDTGLGKIAEGCDVEGPNMDQFKAKLASMNDIAKRLMVTKDLSNNTMSVAETPEKAPKKEKVKEKAKSAPAAEKAKEKPEPEVKAEAKLEELSKKYAMDKTQLKKALHQVSGNVLDLERHLKGEAVTLWTEFEDNALRHPENSDMMKYVLEKKGEQAVAARKKFIGVANK